jgi:hypothetical protein
MLRTVKKLKIYLLSTRAREEISQKFQRIWIQHILLYKKSTKTLDALLKLIQNVRCQYFGFGPKYGKTQKMDFQNTQMGPFAESLIKID